MKPKAALVRQDELADFTRDGRIVAFRWDLIPWSLVLDLDIPAAPEDDERMRRAWMVFDGVVSIDLHFDEAPLPTGLLILSDFDITRTAPDRTRSMAVVINNRVTSSGEVLPNEDNELVVSSVGVLGAVSTADAVPGNVGLDFAVRRRLASDEDFLAVLAGSILPVPSQ